MVHLSPPCCRMGSWWPPAASSLGSTTAFTLNQSPLWAAPSQWLTVAGVVELGAFCLKWKSPNRQSGSPHWPGQGSLSTALQSGSSYPVSSHGCQTNMAICRLSLSVCVHLPLFFTDVSPNKPLAPLTSTWSLLPRRSSDPVCPASGLSKRDEGQVCWLDDSAAGKVDAASSGVRVTRWPPCEDSISGDLGKCPGRGEYPCQCDASDIWEVWGKSAYVTCGVGTSSGCSCAW